MVECTVTTPPGASSMVLPSAGVGRPFVAAELPIELPVAKLLVPLNRSLFTRADTPGSPATKAAEQVIVAIGCRLTLSGELRKTEPITYPAQRETQ